MKREPKHTLIDLRQRQALPLSAKLAMTKLRIREWVEEFGIDGVYVSFSGGKDSTVLLHIVREMYPDVPAVFSDTGLEFPEIRDFVKTFDNVIWVKPKMNFKTIIQTYGYPFLSKELSAVIGGGAKSACNGYGCHIESNPNRFERMKETHPKQYEFIMKPTEKGGLNYKEVIDWLNENCGLNIKY